MKFISLAALALVVILFSLSSTAKADTMDSFTITGSGNYASNVITFTLPSSPTAATGLMTGSSNCPLLGFCMDTTVTLNGLYPYAALVEFGPNNTYRIEKLVNGVPDSWLNSLVYQTSATTYTGGVLTPTFLPENIWTVNAYGGRYSNYWIPVNVNLKIAEIPDSPATTPEPSSLVLLGTGLVGLGGLIRRRVLA